MRSSCFLLLGTLVALMGTACTPKTIPDEQAAIREDQVGDVQVEVVGQQDTIPGTNRFTEEHLALQAAITAGDLDESLAVLNEKVFGPNSLNKVYYTSPAYGGFLDLYVQVGKKIKAEGSEAQKKAWLESQGLFEERFLSTCVGVEDGICEFLGQVLRYEATTLWVVLEIADAKQDPLEKLSVLGAAYDVQNRRRSEILEETYLKVALAVFAEVEEGRARMPIVEQRQHLNNVLSLTLQNKWDEPDADKVAWVELIKPWDYEAVSNKALNEVRKQLIPFLPVYSRINSGVKESLKKKVNERIAKVSQGKKDLSEYPAYAGINLQDIASAPAEVAYVALELYFQNVEITDANAYVANISNKAAFIDEVYEAAKLLVRWDIAQLGIDSTEKMAAKLSEQDAVTNAFYQEVLDWSKTLVPTWTEFHTIRLWSMKTFIESNIKHSRKFDEIETQEFFTSVNRNILRAVTYPNMLAFGYKMMQTEWSATIRILWFKFQLDTAILMDYMMAGQYVGPWFNFTNLQEEKSWWPEEKKALYRSDMLDALHYLFTTRTAELYNIDPNDFIKATGETLIKRRRSVYEGALTAQKQIYFNENSEASKMVRWCEGIKSGNFEPETIPYYNLSSAITPNLLNMKFDELNGTPSFYWGDYYPDLRLERLHTTNDRYRLELEPIMKNLHQYVAIIERASKAHPELGLGDLSEAKAKVQEYEHFKRTYLGVQKAIMEKVGDCLFVAEREAKRRIREVGFANYEYFTKVIHPLMTAVKEGSLSVAEANQVIQDFHGNIVGVQDYIDASNNGDPIFVMTQVTYLLRTKLMLTRGMKFQSPHTEPVDIAPIVGRHLNIPVPSNFLEDPSSNPYMRANTTSWHLYTVQYGEDVEVFGKAATVHSTDENRTAIMANRFTEWDQHELRDYAFNFRYVVEQQVIFYQIPDQVYYDVNKPNCWVTRVEDLGEDCVVEEQPKLDDIAETMNNILKAYKLDQVDEDYFALTGVQGWVGTEALDTVIEYDTSLEQNWMTDTLPYTRLAGIMDLPYQMLDADILGISFMTNWDVKQNEGNDRPQDMSCSGQRDGCYWAWDRVVAMEFFWARKKRPGFLFNYDYKIVEEDFNKVASRILSKYQRMIEVEERSSEFADKAIEEVGSELVLTNVFIPPSEIYGLNINYRNTARAFEKFFSEETESFFTEEHNWPEELNIQ